MMDGLGLAETTPGPLILVTEFVGYLAGHGAGGVWLGLAAAGVTLWATFLPCFLWIFAGAPYVEALTRRPRLNGALTAITAAVVGVILNLSLWFATHVFFRSVGTVEAGPLSLLVPDPASLDPVAVLLAIIAGLLLLWRGWPLPAVLAVAAAGGAVSGLL
jgi:Chromate transporter.